MINYIILGIIIILLLFGGIDPGEGKHVWEDACFITVSTK